MGGQVRVSRLIVSADLADVAEQAAADLPRLTLRLLVGADGAG